MVGGIGFVCFIVDLVVLIRFSDKAKDIKRSMKRLLTVVTDERVEKLVENFVQRCENDDGVITGMGFFHVNRDYVTIVIGIIATYFLLIYQSRDQKLDLRTLRTVIDPTNASHLA
ncbi:uncharacterized protein LOC129598825 [Paramacrobiotus metropolitanus]|uniref:uncharacterized protein LOC129598825 n=1 Tax=Paramacrobiotus metropolitanus TaxID=2943436 RepID=UPI0024462DC7|nr:uncharacterized protein LOC129598825 [Paramacrobiotus metropolitanus]